MEERRARISSGRVLECDHMGDSNEAAGGKLRGAGCGEGVRNGPGQSSHKAQGRVQRWDPAWRGAQHWAGQELPPHVGDSLDSYLSQGAACRTSSLS